MKKIALLQPSYLPWLGYFNQILRVDEFIFLDDVLYTKNDWRNRNKIKTPTGPIWLTLPVNNKNRFSKKILIKDIEIKDREDLDKHLMSIYMNYKKSKYFEELFPLLSEYFEKCSNNLSDLDIKFIKLVCDYLKIKTKFYKTSDINIKESTKTDRIIQICKYFKATHYLTGDAAKTYMDEDLFKKNNIELEYQNYNHPTYSQLWGEFIPYLSIIDLLFNHGRESKNIILNKNEK